MQRRTYIFHGHVQGVGFRATAQWIASRYKVAGYVRNRPDNTVEMVVEGEVAEIDKTFAAVSKEMSRHITRFDTREAAATGEFHDFSIRR